MQANEAPVGHIAQVKVPVASVLSRADWRSERQTQALLGEEVRILQRGSEWSQVSVSAQDRDGRGYVGWMLTSQLAEGFVPDDVHCLRLTKPRATLYAKPSRSAKAVLTAYGNSRLELLEIADGWYRVAVPGNASSAWVSVQDASYEYFPATGKSVVNFALQYLNAPYLWGGLTPLGIDCSGLTYAAYLAHGLLIPRDADEQFQRGTAVDRKHLRPGDLMFFGHDGQVTHVGIYMGDERMLHAFNRKGVHINKLSDTPYYVTNYMRACRYIDAE